MSKENRSKVNSPVLESRGQNGFIENNNKKNNGNNSDIKTHRKQRVDNLDLQLIDLLLAGESSRQCANILKKPISTTQRRVRLLIQGGILKPMFELGYSELGVKRGFLHVYLQDGNIGEIKSKLLSRDGIYSIGVHIGNSDIVGQFVFRDSREVLDLISWSKHLEGVEKVVWSEEVYQESASPKLTSVLNRHGI